MKPLGATNIGYRYNPEPDYTAQEAREDRIEGEVCHLAKDPDAIYDALVDGVKLSDDACQLLALRGWSARPGIDDSVIVDALVVAFRHAMVEMVEENV